MPENTLLTRCMVLGCTILGTDIITREPGMRGGGKGSVCTLSETGILSQATGKIGFTMCQVSKITFQDLPPQLTIPKFLMQCR